VNLTAGDAPPHTFAKIRIAEVARGIPAGIQYNPGKRAHGAAHEIEMGERLSAAAATPTHTPVVARPRLRLAGIARRAHDRIAAFYDLDDASLSARQRLPALDGIRGFAALQITVYHCVIASAAFRINGFKTLGAGLFGVDIFFVLSGFVLFLPWAEARMRGAPPPTLGQYYRRRFRRIAPAYYFMLFFLIVFFTPTYIAPSLVYSWSGLFSVLTHLSFQQAIVMSGLGNWFGWRAQPGFEVNGVVWTLTFELYFYLLLPFVYRFFCGSARKVVTSACIALSVTIVWAWVRFNVAGIMNSLFGIALVSHKNTLARDRVQNLMENLLPTYAAHFALGMAAAYCFLRLRDRVDPHAHAPVSGKCHARAAGQRGLIRRADALDCQPALARWHDHGAEILVPRARCCGGVHRGTDPGDRAGGPCRAIPIRQPTDADRGPGQLRDVPLARAGDYAHRRLPDDHALGLNLEIQVPAPARAAAQLHPGNTLLQTGRGALDAPTVRRGGKFTRCIRRRPLQSRAQR